MKVFQILNHLCHWDATSKFPTVESTFGKFPADVLFVAAPDYVFEGWGYDETSADPWIKPTAPEGWLYDDATGTFYLENPPEELKPVEQRITELQTTVADNKKTYEAKITALTEQNDFLEDCIAEMASVVYADDGETA